MSTYVDDMRAKFQTVATQSHALVIEVLADNKKLIDIITRYEQALRDIEGSAFDCGDRYQTAKEAAVWMQGRAGEALSDLS